MPVKLLPWETDEMIISADEFVRLRVSNKMEEYSRAAVEDAPLEVWMDVVGRYPEMKKWVALNKTVPMEILRTLAVDPDWEVRATVASKRKLEGDLFELLSRDAVVAVRVQVARNAKVPANILDRLAADPSPIVRRALLNRATGEE